jgi:hypothetical protein
MGKQMSDRSTTGRRVWEYATMHPCATLRDIQAALKISSPSVVHFHLKARSKLAKAEILADALRGIIGAAGHPDGAEVALDLIKGIATNAMIAVGELEDAARKAERGK